MNVQEYKRKHSLTEEKRLSMLWDAYHSMPSLQKYPLQRFEENPYAAAAQIEPNIWAISQMAPDFAEHANAYLVLGTEKGVIIDTCYGIGSIKAIVDAITDLPVEVLNTHWHDDHTGGNYGFQRVNLHPLDIEEYQTGNMGPYRSESSSYYEASQVLPDYSGKYVPLSDGQEMDLGGGTVIKVFHTPGHTPGGCSFLEMKSGALFAGDAFMGVRRPDGWSHGELRCVEALLDGLRKIDVYRGSITSVSTGHGQYHKSSEVFVNMLEMAEDIVKDPFVGMPIPVPVMGVMLHYVKGQHAFNYSPESVYKDTDRIVQ